MFRVLHAPIELAGQVGLICRFLNQKGISAIGYNTFQTYLNYKNEIIESDIFQLQQLFPYAMKEFDIFHFHNSYTFFQDHQDLPLLADQGKKIVMHHRGNDVRFSAMAKKGSSYRNPYVYTGSSFPDDMIDKNLRFFSKYTSAVIVQDYELYQYVKDYYEKVYVLPRLIDISRIKPKYPSASPAPVIVHAPTDREFKGSDTIEKVLNDLQKEYQFTYKLVQNMSHKAATNTYRTADIVIDQIRCGAYGNLSVEAMALGKPVIAYIRDDLVDKYPKQLPIVSANPDTLREKLIELIKNPELRNKLGKQGRQYVENYHEGSIVIKQLIKIYKNIMKN